ncbi:MAG: hypothetical protein JO108_36645 [Acidobacteriaceae bacterium]|nr:hypothetical protein [Acidobacteriaceae bacterium]
MTENISGMEGIGTNFSAAIGVAANRAKVMKPFQVSALALPVADRIIDKLELTETAEIENGEDGAEDTLQTGVLTLLGKQVHLQETLVGALLHLDQVGNGYRSFNLRKINSLAESSV